MIKSEFAILMFLDLLNTFLLEILLIFIYKRGKND